VSSEKNFNWQRLWIPIGYKYWNDQNGFPNFNSYDIQTGETKTGAKTLEELENEKCLVLIGDPGTGKSTEIKKIEHKGALTFKYHFKKYATIPELFDAIKLDRELSLNFDRKTYLYFDGLDEGLLNIKNLHNSLITFLASLKENDASFFNKIYIRITCRSVIWSEISQGALPRLREEMGEDLVKVLELAPLCQKEIRIAVEQSDSDSSDFVTLVCDNNLQSFCLDPQSLNPLIDGYKNGLLKKGIQRSELYEGLMKGKCIEVNSEYKDKKSLTPDQRFNFAARIAAYCVLSNRTAIWIDEDKGLSLDSDLILDELVRDHFKIDDKDQIIDNKGDLKEVLDTALFSMGNHNFRFVFKHRGEQEFLAAWHLNKLNLNNNQLAQLLTSANDRFRGIPQIQEVIVWLATLNQSTFSLMVEKEPLLLLRCEREFTISERKLLFKSIVSNARDFKIVDTYDDERYYTKLNFPQISKAIKPFLHKKANTSLQRICVHIAQACSASSVQKELLFILNDSTISTYLRKQAVEALASTKNRKTLLMLVRFAIEENTDDIDDEIKGTALKSLYPEMLSIKDVFKSLTSIKRDSLYGSYKGFLDTLNESIPDRDIEIAVEFISNWDFDFIARHSYSPFERLRIKILERAYHHLETGNTLTSVVKCIKLCLSHHLQFTRPDNINERRQISKTLIENWDTNLFIHQLISSHGGQLIDSNDWDWLVEYFETSNERSTRLVIVNILKLILDLSNAKECVQFLEIATQFEEIKSNKYWFGPIELDSKDAKDLKAFYQKPVQKIVRRTREERMQESLTRKIREQIIKIENGEIGEWWKLIHFLSDANDFEFDVTKHKYWSTFEKDSSERILTFSKRYLQEYIPNSSWIFSPDYDRRELSGYCAIIFISKFESNFISSLPDKFWGQWLDIIIYCSLSDFKNELSATQQGILTKCRLVSQQLFDDSLILQIRHFLNKKSIYNLSKIQFILDPTFGEKLIKLTIESSLDDPDYLLSILFKRCELVAKKFAWKEVRDLFEEKIQPHREKLAIFCGARLFEYIKQDEWNRYFTLIHKRPDVAKRIFLQSITSSDSRYRDQLNQLTAEQRADLLIWIVLNFPKKEDPVRSTIYSPEARDHVVTYRYELIRSLIEEGSIESVDSLKRVSTRFYNNEDFKWWLVSATEFMRRNTWVPISPNHLQYFFNDRERRVVRNEKELSAIIIESLKRLEKKLQGENPSAFFLWNKTSKGYEPKDENSLSDFVKMHLEYDLTDRDIVINREVEIKRGSSKGKGERTDLLVQAISPDNKITVVIETKKCNHGEVETAMESQLRKRYLNNYNSSTGIYLVGWYYGDHLPNRKKLNKRGFMDMLEKQAIGLSNTMVELKTVVLDCTI
jgi:hypothetical protein